MKKLLVLFAFLALYVLLLLTVVGTRAEAAVADASWSLPTTYSDSTSIAAADQARIVVTIYQGNSATGPWTLIGTAPAGATSLNGMAVTAIAGVTYHFTAKSTLDGVSSVYATSTSAILPFATPNPPGALNVILKR